MQLYEVTAEKGVTLAAGNVRLDKKQAGAREYALNLVKAGEEISEYEITKPTQFKRGEVFEYDGVVSKAMALNLQLAEDIAEDAVELPDGCPFTDEEALTYADLTVKKLANEIATWTDKDRLVHLMTFETVNQNRQGALKVINDRIEALDAEKAQ